MSYETPHAVKEPVEAYLTDFRIVALRAAAMASFGDPANPQSPTGPIGNLSRDEGFSGFISPAGVDVVDNAILVREANNFEAMLRIAGYDEESSARATRQIGTRLKAMAILGATASAYIMQIVNIETNEGHPRSFFSLGCRATFPEKWRDIPLAQAAVLAYPKHPTEGDLHGIDTLLGGRRFHPGVKTVGALTYWHNRRNPETPLPVPLSYKPPRIIRALSRIPFPYRVISGQKRA